VCQEDVEGHLSASRSSSKQEGAAQRARSATHDGRAASGLIGHRDRALLLLGFAGGFRRAELVALTVHELSFVREGLEVFILTSKTDQEQEGHLKMADRIRKRSRDVSGARRQGLA
jgi:site-specific recombinase XerD